MGRQSPITRQKQDELRLTVFFENIAAQLFIWKGLPKQLRSGWIERKLYTGGQLAFFKADWKKDEYDGYMMLPLARSGNLNVYSELTTYNCISPMKQFKRTFEDAVLIRDNELRIPTYILIQPLIEELADIREAMRINRNSSCKTPMIFTASKGDRTALSSLNNYKKITDNEPFIIKSDLPLEVTYELGSNHCPYYGDKLRDEYNNVFNEILSILGIPNNPVEKAERVNLIEASSNRGLIIDSIDSRLSYRKEACEQINAMFPDMPEPLSCEINNAFTRDMVAQGLANQSIAPNAGGSIDNVNNELSAAR